MAGFITGFAAAIFAFRLGAGAGLTVAAVVGTGLVVVAVGTGLVVVAVGASARAELLTATTIKGTKLHAIVQRVMPCGNTRCADAQMLTSALPNAGPSNQSFTADLGTH